MEDNKEKDIADKSIFREDFKDFDEIDDMSPIELDEDIAARDSSENTKQKNLKEETNEIKQEIKEEQIENFNNKVQEFQEELIKEGSDITIEGIVKSDNGEEITQFSPSPWDNLKEENLAVKKYLFYISKDFTAILDNLTADERSAYINDAIQKKIDIEIEKKRKNSKKRIVIHCLIMIFTFILAAPVVLMFSHKAIMATFDNYKYSQENFEKLYKARFEKDKAYIRSVQYNREQKLKNKH